MGLEKLTFSVKYWWIGIVVGYHSRRFFFTKSWFKSSEIHEFPLGKYFLENIRNMMKMHNLHIISVLQILLIPSEIQNSVVVQQ